MAASALRIVFVQLRCRNRGAARGQSASRIAETRSAVRARVEAHFAAGLDDFGSDPRPKPGSLDADL
jgi:hypothetical protein